MVPTRPVVVCVVVHGHVASVGDGRLVEVPGSIFSDPGGLQSRVAVRSGSRVHYTTKT